MEKHLARKVDKELIPKMTSLHVNVLIIIEIIMSMHTAHTHYL